MLRGWNSTDFFKRLKNCHVEEKLKFLFAASKSGFTTNGAKNQGELSNFPSSSRGGG